jgi:hypothetical protein
LLKNVENSIPKMIVTSAKNVSNKKNTMAKANVRKNPTANKMVEMNKENRAIGAK